MKVCITSALRSIIAILDKFLIKNMEKSWNSPNTNQNPDLFIKSTQPFFTNTFRKIKEGDKTKHSIDYSQALEQVTKGQIGLNPKDGTLFKKVTPYQAPYLNTPKSF